LKGDNFVLIGKTKLRREISVAQPGPAKYPDPSEEPPDVTKEKPDSVRRNSHSVAETNHQIHNPGIFVRFWALLTLFIVAVGSLVFAITQNSFRGIMWMVVTTAITGICFYFAREEFSGAKRAPNP
jgi:hypothetical protein